MTDDEVTARSILVGLFALAGLAALLRDVAGSIAAISAAVCLIAF